MEDSKGGLFILRFFPVFLQDFFPGFCLIWLLSFLAFGLCLLGVWAF